MRIAKKAISILLIMTLCLGTMATLASVSAEGILYGNCNDDKEIDLKDSLVLRQYIAKYDVTINEEAADVVYDGKINSKDSLVLRQYLAEYDVVLGPTTTTEPQPQTETYTVDQMLASSNLVGRSVVDGTVLKMEQTTSGIEFMADCEGSITFEATCSGDGGYMGVMIDDDFDNMTRVTLTGGTHAYTVDANLASGEHKIRIVKLNEWVRNTMQLLSVTVEGTLTGAKPQEKELKLEFYGDSITVGYGNLESGGGKWNWQYQDGYRTYAAYCADELGAEFSSVATSGYGVTTGFSDKTQTWDKFAGYSLVNSKTEWDFDAYQADIVVVNLGTNDFSYYNNTGNNASISNEDFKAACQELLDWIRSKNPDCEIVWVLGMNYVADVNNIKPLTVLQELDEELDYLHFTKITTSQSGGDSHPSVADHEKAGATLAEYIRTEILN